MIVQLYRLKVSVFSDESESDRRLAWPNVPAFFATSSSKTRTRADRSFLNQLRPSPHSIRTSLHRHIDLSTHFSHNRRLYFFCELRIGSIAASSTSTFSSILKHTKQQTYLHHYHASRSWLERHYGHSAREL